MKQLHIKPKWIALGLFAWLVITNALVGIVHLTDWWPFKILLFASLLFLPGVALLRSLQVTTLSFAMVILYSFGLSLLVLMLGGLAVNQILFALGVTQPLQLPYILGVWNGITIILILLSIKYNPWPLQFKKPKSFSKHSWVLLLLSATLPLLATIGAYRLNNGDDGLIALITLGVVALVIVYIVLVRHRLPDGLIAWMMFVIGLTVLLMTSLRGWDIMGHDIEREFRVYTLTHVYGHWDIALDRDPYNACLSITILPEVLAKLLNTSGLVVFKFILQIVFAACPAVVYLLLRRYAPKLGALVGCMLFICYPTFINDSAMLTRQGVAYLFFALAIMVMARRVQHMPSKLLFLLFSLGAILSHYSTAYMFVGLFAVATVWKLGIIWWRRRRGQQAIHTYHTVLSPLFACALFLMTFTWYTQITATSTGVVDTLRTSLSNIPKIFSDDNKSSDTSTALFFASSKTQVDLYESYLTKFSTHVPDLAHDPTYLPSLTTDDLPLTWLGEKARLIGFEPSLIVTARQNFAKLLQLLALCSVLYLTYRLIRLKSDDLGLDFACLSLAGLALLGLMVVLPVLSVSYGVLRAFQQALIFLVLPITLFLMRIGTLLWPRLRTTLATSGVVLLFLLFTGAFAQLLGGVSPSLSMNNQGLYFGLYNAPRADAESFAWMKAHIPKAGDVRSANPNRALMHDPKYPFNRQGILPSQLEPDSYAYLDYAQVRSQKFYTYYDSSPLIMSFPLDYYDIVKNQIYSTTTTRVYQ